MPISCSLGVKSGRDSTDLAGLHAESSARAPSSLDDGRGLMPVTGASCSAPGAARTTASARTSPASFSRAASVAPAVPARTSEVTATRREAARGCCGGRRASACTRVEAESCNRISSFAASRAEGAALPTMAARAAASAMPKLATSSAAAASSPGPPRSSATQTPCRKRSAKRARTCNRRWTMLSEEPSIRQPCTSTRRESKRSVACE
mmetsp:Transcript_49028/g.154021  ORF Transcript_49028/g.154021 Transcript_49028/m.154021 type:complete len:208 (+) Transcript_49028:97-720(+)